MKKFRKMLALPIALVIAASLAACGSDTNSSSTTETTSSSTATTTTETTSSSTATPTATPVATSETEVLDSSEFVTVSAKNGEGEFIDMDVPYYPTKVVFMDYVSLDMCAALGILDEIEYMAVQDALPAYLAEVVDSDIVNLGGLKSYQEDTTIMTEILEFEPELIFTSGRSAGDYDSFMEIVADDGGVVSSSIAYVPSTYESFKEINERNASIFGKEAEMAELIAQYDERLEALKSWGEGQTAMMTIFTGGAMNVLGNESRCSMIFNDLGFENVGTEVDTSHGDTASYEALLALNPDYIFVLDRDSAIAAEGATSAMELLDNEIVQQSDAWKNGNVVVLDPIVWYMVEGGIIAMDTMLSDLEAGMLGDGNTSDTTAATDGFITISSKNGEGEFIDMEVPVNPTKVAFMDYVAFDMCIALDILDNIEFITVQGDNNMPEYLTNVFKDQEVNLGGLKSYQEDTTIMTEILEFEPELIFTSGRSASDYDSFMEIVADNGGVVSSSITYVPSTYESFKEINTRNASIFGLDNEMAELISQYDNRLEALKGWGEGKTAMMTIFTGGSMNVLGNESRCSMIFNDLGFENVGTEVDTSHGDTASYEALLALNPDYIFVLDRDSAIGAEGATGAMELLDNEIVHQSDAWKNGKVVVLDPLVWYLVEGGVIAMDTMLSDLEAGMALEN